VTRSVSVHSQLPDLSWCCPVLSTSNYTGREMAAQFGLSWAEQDEVRFIDIPVPPAEVGGIFDRLGDKVDGIFKPLRDKSDKGRKAEHPIHRLERLIETHHGAPLRPWIEFLIAKHPRKRQLQRDNQDDSGASIKMRA
jgi:hypothetical protein